MADDLHLRVVTDSDARGLKEAEKELAAAGKEAGKLDDVFVSAGKSSDKLDDSLHEQTTEIKKLQAEYARTKKSVTDLTHEWLDADRENDQIVRRELRREKSRLGELQRAAKEFESNFKIRFSHDLSEFTAVGEQAGAAVVEGIGTSIIKMPAMLEGGAAGPLIGAIGGLLTAALPGLGALVGGALTGALGTGAMAAGILTAAHNSEVKSAAKAFGTSITDEFFQGTAFIKPIIAGLDILKQGFRDLGINALLAPLAPTVTTIAHGIADFVNNLKDNGLSATLGRMDHFAHIAAEGLASAGDALGFFVDEVSKDKGSMDGLRAFFAILNGSVRLAAVGINILEKVFHVFSMTLAGAAGIAQKFSPIDLGPFLRGATAIVGIMPKASTLGMYMANSQHEITKRTEEEAEALRELRSALDEARNAVNRFMGEQMNMDEANLAAKKGILDLKEALAENRGAWDENTAAGQAHRQAVLDQIGTLERQREALVANTGDWAAADIQYLKGLEDIKKVAIAAGITGAALEAMMKDYRLRILADLVVNITPTIFGAGGPLANIWGPFGKKRARGGPVMAGQPYVVGENQPELFVPSQNGMIIPQVPRADSQGSGSSMAQNARPVAVYGGGLGEMAFEWLRDQISARGGTLAVLGIRS